MRIFFTAILFLTFMFEGFSQFKGKDFSVVVDGVYTTSAKIYLNPNSSDPQLRNNNFPMSDVFSYGVSIRYRISNSLLIALGSEYMKAVETGANLTLFSGTGTRTIKVDDGFELIPIEFSLYYILPFSTENFKFTMGGGAAYYLGGMIRTFGDASVSSSVKKTAYGIHVMVAMDYFFMNNISLKSEMKFRDPQFSVTSRYNKETINYNGEILKLAQKEFDSKINVDGVTFVLGLAYHF